MEVTIFNFEEGLNYDIDKEVNAGFISKPIKQHLLK
jgi:hypothetical protein